MRIVNSNLAALRFENFSVFRSKYPLWDYRIRLNLRASSFNISLIKRVK